MPNDLRLSPFPAEPSAFTRGAVAAAAFTGLYLAAAVVAAIRASNGEFIFYLVVMAVLVAAVAAMHLRVRLTAAALWALSVWGLLHMAGGLVPVPASWPIDGNQRVLYSLWLVPHRLKYDQIVHAYGFGVATWVAWQALGAALPPGAEVGPGGRPRWGLLVLCAAAGMGFGALNEVVEFFATLLVPETNVGGYVNTGWDLVSNTVGATAAAVLLRVAGRAGGRGRG